MRPLFFLMAILTVNSLQAQNGECDDSWTWYINFDDGNCMERLIIDTVGNPNNVWQVGEPDKSVFTFAYSKPNAIVTDTLNPYAPNDTSSFIATHVVQETGGLATDIGWTHLGGRYWVDSDSLNDFGTIEFSPDNGTVWYDLINDTTIQDSLVSGTNPVLTGRSSGWRSFFFELDGFREIHEFFPGDTVLYRFSFISDSMADQRDGLMFDNLYFEDLVWGIEENSRSYFSSKAFPSPSRNDLQITFDNLTSEPSEIIVFDGFGRAIFQQQTSDAGASFSIGELEAGIYYYSVTKLRSREVGYGRFVKN